MYKIHVLCKKFVRKSEKMSIIILQKKSGEIMAEKKYIIDNEELMKEWDWELNKNINPQELSVNSNIIVNWECAKGHKWKTSIYNRACLNSGCPCCSNRKVWLGYNDLDSLFPDLAKEFDVQKNYPNTPKTVVAYGSKKYWWICPAGHSYEAHMNKRTERNHGCPYCSGHRVLENFNDIETTNPEIILEWDKEKNGDNKPTMYSKGSGYNAWWKCSAGHSYQSKIIDRCKGRGCPYCSGNKVIAGINDLETVYPELSKEWHPTRNGSMKPREVFSKSGKKYWWICKQGHEYQATPHNRAKGRGCSICTKELHVSFPEKVIYFYISKVFKDARENYNPGWKNQNTIDIYIPSLSLGIEYDGKAWHKDTNRDLIKDELCKENKIFLIRIREKGCPKLLDNVAIYEHDGSNYKECLTYIEDKIYEIRGIKILFDVDLNRDRAVINEMTATSEKKKNIIETHPEVVKEWNWDKNGMLKPDYITYGSSKKVWWKCSKGHEWIASINNRCRLERKCPYCAHQKILSGYNDLSTTNPELLEDWDWEKNIDVSPSEIFAKSSKNKIWWKCSKCGYKWIDSPNGKNKTQCPNCHKKEEI